jgi:glutaryl-CoA dehydrogenase (non-decarboxylating)
MSHLSQISHLSQDERAAAVRFREFARDRIAPHAAAADRDQELPREVIGALAAAGFLGATTECRWGGRGMDMVTYGLLTEELGRVCQNVRNFVAVEDMVCLALSAWGTRAQRERWLPAIAEGSVLAAFALTEPGNGSDAANIATTATPDGDDVVLRGDKKWISFAQIADLYLVFAKYQGKHTAFLVERDTPGLLVDPIRDLMGLRGSMLGELLLRDCRVPAENMVGRPGAGLVFVASSALDLGRYSTAWGSVGLARACLEESARYASHRVQYDAPIGDHQLVRRMLADMVTDVAAARLLCHHAGVGKDNDELDTVHPTLIAKYRASTVATRVAADAVQIHGAQGIGDESPVARHYRDAKVMEIIEGTTQIQQSILGQYAVEFARTSEHTGRGT